jgi:hypothetical protein
MLLYLNSNSEPIFKPQPSEPILQPEQSEPILQPEQSEPILQPEQSEPIIQPEPSEPIIQPEPSEPTLQSEQSEQPLEHLNTIFDKYDTDKNSKFHNYSRQYNDLLKEYRNKPIKYLEIGVFNGGSIKAFREVFKNATCILGLDINSNCKEHENIENNIFVEIGDATDAEFIKTITEKYGTFDVILDDGSHVNKDVINTFQLLFPLLNDNGVYIVEDTLCYKCLHYVRFQEYNDHLSYFFRYIPILNQCRYDSHEGVKDFCSDPYKIIKKTNDVFEYSIDKIEYGCSYIAIHKKIKYHWIANN